MKSRWFLVSAILFLVGCGYSKNPLSDPRTSKADQRLVGVWRLPDEGDYHVSPAGKGFPDSMMRATCVQHEKGKPKSSYEFFVFPSEIAGKTYLNIVDAKVWKPDAVDIYLLVKYQVEGDKLLVWPIDADVQRQAIKSGKIKGVANWDAPPKFTDTTENVARFVAQAGDALFLKDTIQLERLGNGVRASEKPPLEAKPGRQPSSLLKPTPPLRPLRDGLMVDKNNIIWDHGKPVGVWGIESNGPNPPDRGITPR